MPHTKSVLDLLLPQDRAQLTELQKTILWPLFYCLFRKGARLGHYHATIIVPYNTLALKAHCSHVYVKNTCKRARDIGILTWQWVFMNTGAHPGYQGANRFRFSDRYRTRFNSFAKPLTPEERQALTARRERIKAFDAYLQSLHNEKGGDHDDL